MPTLRAVIVLLLCAAAAGADPLQPLIDRPVTLPRGKVDTTLHFTYTNWSNSVLGGGSGSTDGETLALGLDFGATDLVQIGLGLVFPINPGAAFGSALASGSFAVDKNAALRLDAGYESVGANGNFDPENANRYFAGIGAAIKVPITPTVAFVTGRTGPVQFGHFNNLGSNGTGVYFGSSFLTELSSDFLVVSGGNLDTGTNLGINLPVGLLLQPDPHLALTLQAGYSVVIEIPSVGSALASHFVPIGLEAVVSPVSQLDIGARFLIDGYVGSSGGGGGGPGYFDLRALMFWFRVHV